MNFFHFFKLKDGGDFYLLSDLTPAQRDGYERFYRSRVVGVEVRKIFSGGVDPQRPMQSYGEFFCLMTMAHVGTQGWGWRGYHHMWMDGLCCAIPLNQKLFSTL